MGSGGHSWHKKDWIKAAAIAAAGAATGGLAYAAAPAALGAGALGEGAALGGAGLGAGEGLLGASGAAEMASGGLATPGIGGLIGASTATPLTGAAGALAGDAYMPAALGEGGGGAPSLGQVMGGNINSLNSQYGGMFKTGMKGLGIANKLGLLSQPQQQAPMQMPHSQIPTQNTQVFPQSSMGGVDMNDPKVKALIMAYLQQQPGNSGQWQV